jgi:hypothetical protein
MRGNPMLTRMGRTHSRRFVAMLACCVAASAVLVGNASAGQFQESFHDEGTWVIENFCGVAGLTVTDEFVFDGKDGALQRGPNGFEYFHENLKETEVLTNVVNGKTVTLVNRANGKDLKLTDNGDGTLTAVTFGTGNTVLYGPDGKAIARNPGQSRFELLIDQRGTPTDPSDDELISIELVKGSTGRSDDICAAAIEALT